MYLWIIKRPNILAHLESISVACVICGGNQCRVLSYQGRKYQLLLVLYIATVILRTAVLFLLLLLFLFCFVFFIASLMSSFSIAVPLLQQLSIKLAISLKYNRLIFFLEHNLYGFPQSDLVVQNLNLVFLCKKIWRNALALKSTKVQGTFREKFILTLSSSVVFHLQNHVPNFF